MEDAIRRSARLFFGLCLLAVLLPVGAAAQNLVVNPNFDVDLSGWTAAGGVWSPLDLAGSPSSGSATWNNTNASTSGSLYVTQCIEISGVFEGFYFGSWVFIPSGQTGTGIADLSLAFYSDTACSDYIDGFGGSAMAELDVWRHVNLEGWVPTGAGSARIGALNQKYGVGEFQVHHDSVIFVRHTLMIFGDGFESADVSDWDSSIGGRR